MLHADIRRWAGASVMAFMTGALACTGAVGQDKAVSEDGTVTPNPGKDNPGLKAPPGGQSSTDPGPNLTPAMTPGSVAMPGAKPRAGVVPLRRLSRAEYNNALRDLLGDVGDAANDFASDTTGQSGFDEGAIVSGGEFDRMMDTFERLARTVTETRLATITTCDPAKSTEDICATEFITRLGRRVYRHPLSPDEQKDLTAVYQDARKILGLDFKNGLRLTLQAMLASPRFNYHWPLGDRTPKREGDLLQLDGYELASRLSFFLWQTTPDDALLDAAEKGELLTPAGVMKQARRMLDDKPRASRGTRGFFGAWLDVDGLDIKDREAPADPKLGLGSGIHAAMAQETLTFVDDLVLGMGDRKFQTLLTSNQTFLNEGLAKIYGVTGITGKDLRRATVNASERAGILTQAAFLAASHTTPRATVIKRGRFLFERLATCDAVPAPEGMIPEPPEVNGTVREQLAAHSSNGVCRSCHSLMDPIGFAFQAFDSVGRTRTKDEKNRPLDTTGTLPLARGMISFTGAVDLAKKLADLPESQRCFSKQVFRYALKKPVTGDDEASATALGDLFLKGGQDMRELLLSSTQVFSFYFRAPSKGELLP